VRSSTEHAYLRSWFESFHLDRLVVFWIEWWLQTKCQERWCQQVQQSKHNHPGSCEKIAHVSLHYCSESDFELPSSASAKSMCGNEHTTRLSREHWSLGQRVCSFTVSPRTYRMLSDIPVTCKWTPIQIKFCSTTAQLNSCSKIKRLTFKPYSTWYVNQVLKWNQEDKMNWFHLTAAVASLLTCFAQFYFGVISKPYSLVPIQWETKADDLL